MAYDVGVQVLWALLGVFAIGCGKGAPASTPIQPVPATDARAAAEDVIGSDRYLVMDGEHHLLVEKSISIANAQVESRREVNGDWGASPLHRRPTKDGFELQREVQGGESMHCKKAETAVKCSVGKRTTLWALVSR